jgi:hypothetical protein
MPDGRRFTDIGPDGSREMPLRGATYRAQALPTSALFACIRREK